MGNMLAMVYAAVGGWDIKRNTKASSKPRKDAKTGKSLPVYSHLLVPKSDTAKVTRYVDEADAKAKATPVKEYAARFVELTAETVEAFRVDMMTEATESLGHKPSVEEARSFAKSKLASGIVTIRVPESKRGGRKGTAKSQPSAVDELFA